MGIPAAYLVLCLRKCGPSPGRDLVGSAHGYFSVLLLGFRDFAMIRRQAQNIFPYLQGVLTELGFVNAGFFGIA